MVRGWEVVVRGRWIDVLPPEGSSSWERNITSNRFIYSSNQSTSWINPHLKSLQRDSCRQMSSHSQCVLHVEFQMILFFSNERKVFLFWKLHFSTWEPLETFLLRYWRLQEAWSTMFSIRKTWVPWRVLLVRGSMSSAYSTQGSHTHEYRHNFIFFKQLRSLTHNFLRLKQIEKCPNSKSTSWKSFRREHPQLAIDFTVGNSTFEAMIKAQKLEKILPQNWENFSRVEHGVRHWRWGYISTWDTSNHTLSHGVHQAQTLMETPTGWKWPFKITWLATWRRTQRDHLQLCVRNGPPSAGLLTVINQYLQCWTSFSSVEEQHCWQMEDVGSV